MNPESNLKLRHLTDAVCGRFLWLGGQWLGSDGRGGGGSDHHHDCGRQCGPIGNFNFLELRAFQVRVKVEGLSRVTGSLRPAGPPPGFAASRPGGPGRARPSHAGVDVGVPAGRRGGSRAGAGRVAPCRRRLLAGQWPSSGPRAGGGGPGPGAAAGTDLWRLAGPPLRPAGPPWQHKSERGV